MKRSLFIVFFMVLLIPCIVFAAGRPPLSPEYSLDVGFDITHAKVSGTARISAPAGKELVVHTGSLKIIEVRSGRHKIKTDVQDGILKLHPSGGDTIMIRYEGVFRAGEAGQGGNYGVVSNTIDERGISLTEVWYPYIDDLSVYHLRATLPEGFTAVSEADEIRKSVSNGQVTFIFDFPHPAGGISFIAGRDYDEVKDTVNGIGLYVYFFHEDRSLAGAYIEYAKKYLRLYEGMLGKYPYKRFSIVENFLPSGYSMPTFTMLGREVVRLPFIVETSLGHEILHQWFGNLVYVDYGRGNWCEGLTVYLADHLYEQQRGKGWEYRKQILIDYGSYVNVNNEFPLREFTGRTGFSSRAIGYGKAAMVFHMVRQEIGEAAFNASIRDLVRERRFQRTSWDDIRRIFEKDSGKKLEWFFKQWVDEPGLANISVGPCDMKKNGPKYEASFVVEQGPKAYTLELPLKVVYPGGRDEHFIIPISEIKTPLKISVSERPEKIVIDDRYDIARRLTVQEIPAVIAGIIGAERPVIVLPAGQKEIYSSVIEAFRERGGVEKQPSEISDSDMKNSTIVILGNDNPVAEQLFGSMKNEAGFSITVRHNPRVRRRMVGIIDAKSREEADAALPKIFHYGKYSTLLFDQGKNIFKKTEETERGINVEWKDETAAVDVSTISSLHDAIEHVSGKRIVYVGEYHDRFSNHVVELEVIKALYRKNNKMAIGLEMFQRPFQKVLDEYIAGGIDEKTMLKDTEYFKRWGFDYNLYRPILAFAREEKIPVIALNIQNEIVHKVSAGGIDSLPQEDKKSIPGRMDFSDEDYRERLHEIFEKHGGSFRRNFDFFYQAQILWDESMSQSIDDFLKENPDFLKDGQLVVLAGNGHLTYGSGIPKRTFRRNGLDYAIILNDIDVDKGIANYIVYPKPVEWEPSPKIMAVLDDAGGRIRVSGFPEGSISKRAGLKEGDVIISLDDVPVSTIDDIRIDLLYKKKGEQVKVKILRKRFMLGDVEKDFSFIL